MEIAPLQNEIEVSVFGPGYGECVLIHTGNNEWIIVDSCVDSKSKKPAVLNYLNNINVNPSEAVKLIVATHWHDDHIRGLSQIVELCSSADLICSSALAATEFLKLVSFYTDRSMMVSSGVDEFTKILKIKSKLNSKKFNIPKIKLASSDKILFCKNTSTNKNNINCKVYSLSPSDADILLSQINFAKEFPLERETKFRIPSITPNQTSVVLWIEFDNISILLGSDLEFLNKQDQGWDAILNLKILPTCKAKIYKIAHHGSKNSDNELIWKNLLVENPTTATTPYSKGTKLPTKEDVKRICSFTSNSYISSKFRKRKVKGRSNIVEKQIKETVLGINKVHSSFGHVRIRTLLTSEVKVELFGDACKLVDFYDNKD